MVVSLRAKYGSPVDRAVGLLFIPIPIYQSLKSLSYSGLTPRIVSHKNQGNALLFH
ncbi:MAG: hypothetical protein PWP57_700 [Candidatus Atribacteria bacterium]|nr:hypothetical protein [Candidatus Atribacteria bacterium]